MRLSLFVITLLLCGLVKADQELDHSITFTCSEMTADDCDALTAQIEGWRHRFSDGDEHILVSLTKTPYRYRFKASGPVVREGSVCHHRGWRVALAEIAYFVEIDDQMYESMESEFMSMVPAGEACPPPHASPYIATSGVTPAEFASIVTVISSGGFKDLFAVRHDELTETLGLEECRQPTSELVVDMLQTISGEDANITADGAAQRRYHISFGDCVVSFGLAGDKVIAAQAHIIHDLRGMG